MRGIIKSNLTPFLLYTLFGMALSTGIWIRAIGRLRLVIGAFNGVIFFLFAVTAVIMSESKEERHNGYSIMAALPVTLEEIVGGKFILCLASIIIMATYNIVFFSFFESAAGVFAGCVNIIIITSSLAIAFTGVTYAVAFRFGTKALTMMVTGLMLMLNVLGLIAFSVRPNRIFDSIPSLATHNVLLVFIATVPASLALYLFFMKRAPATLKKNLFT